MKTNNTWTKGTALVLCVALLTMGMVAFAVGASDAKEKEPKDKKTTYVGLGIGDHVISCPFPVTVSNDTVGTVTVGAGLSNVCLGGTFGDLDVREDNGDWVLTDEEGNPIEWWEVWTHDYVWNLLDIESDVVPDADFKVAGFARIQLEYTQTFEKGDPEVTQTCVLATVDDALDPDDQILPEDHLDICVIIPGTTKTSVKNTHNFGFCGQGGVKIDHSVVDPKKLDKFADDEENITATKTVFLDGPLFFQLDCPLVEPLREPIEPIWRLVAQTVNEVICTVTDPLGCPIQIFEEIPGIGSECFQGKQPETGDGLNVGVIGIVGTIGWNHDEPKCEEENPFHDENWTTVQGLFTPEIKNAPDV